MQNHFGLLVTDVMPIFMIIALDVFVIMRFSINCSIVICYPPYAFFERKASSETYGPRVYFPSYIFRSIKPKIQKYLAVIYLYLLYFAFYLTFISISIRYHSCK